MCGLVGGYRVPITSDALDGIRHRGPDDDGWAFIAPDTSLGHTRLAIQDLDPRAACPFTYGPVTLTYNGELWNTEQLRAEGTGWRTTGDTEQAARILAEDGWRGLDRLDGMFALAWHDASGDPQRAGTWLARDRYGKVPLYAVRARDRWRWASEIKAMPYGVPATAVAPGTAVHLDTGRVHTWARPGTPDAPEPDILAKHLARAVDKRMISDRPVCFLLSGGLDSSLILALAVAAGRCDAVAYTAVHDPRSADLKAARALAADLGVTLIEVPVPEPTRPDLRAAVAAVEIPMKAQVEIALACLPLARAIAADGFRVVLSGEAADELFGGYRNLIRAAHRADDEGWRALRQAQVAKMARGNFVRVNKVFMAAGVEARLPFMDRAVVDLALAAGKADCPPGKGLLKRAARGIVPDWVIKRQKDTFQGGSGLADAAARAVRKPDVFYHAEARSLFGYLPKG